MTTRAMRERVDRLQADRVPFVHARVVLAERPTSAKPGDEAIVLADGTIEGFVGGQCALATLRAQGLAVLERRESTLIRIAGTPEPDQPGRLVVHNPCQSGGTLEIFMEQSCRHHCCASSAPPLSEWLWPRWVRHSATT